MTIPTENPTPPVVDISGNAETVINRLFDVSLSGPQFVFTMGSYRLSANEGKLQVHEAITTRLRMDVDFVKLLIEKVQQELASITPPPNTKAN